MWLKVNERLGSRDLAHLSRSEGRFRGALAAQEARFRPAVEAHRDYRETLGAAGRYDARFLPAIATEAKAGLAAVERHAGDVAAGLSRLLAAPDTRLAAAAASLESVVGDPRHTILDATEIATRFAAIMHKSVLLHECAGDHRSERDRLRDAL